MFFCFFPSFSFGPAHSLFFPSLPFLPQGPAQQPFLFLLSTAWPNLAWPTLSPSFPPAWPSPAGCSATPFPGPAAQPEAPLSSPSSLSPLGGPRPSGSSPISSQTQARPRVRPRHAASARAAPRVRTSRPPWPPYKAAVSPLLCCREPLPKFRLGVRVLVGLLSPFLFSPCCRHRAAPHRRPPSPIPGASFQAPKRIPLLARFRPGQTRAKIVAGIARDSPTSPPLWQNRSNYSGSSALLIAVQLQST
jgi:hypothetical protein